MCVITTSVLHVESVWRAANAAHSSSLIPVQLMNLTLAAHQGQDIGSEVVSSYIYVTGFFTLWVSKPAESGIQFKQFIGTGRSFDKKKQ